MRSDPSPTVQDFEILAEKMNWTRFFEAGEASILLNLSSNASSLCSVVCPMGQ